MSHVEYTVGRPVFFRVRYNPGLFLKQKLVGGAFDGDPSLRSELVAVTDAFGVPLAASD